MEANIVLRYKNIQFEAKESNKIILKKIFQKKGGLKHIFFSSHYEILPHIQIKFTDINNGKSKWFFVPVEANIKKTAKSVLSNLNDYFCRNTMVFSYLSQHIYDEIEKGKYDNFINCDILEGLNKQLIF